MTKTRSRSGIGGLLTLALVSAVGLTLAKSTGIFDKDPQNAVFFTVSWKLNGDMDTKLKISYRVQQQYGFAQPSGGGWQHSERVRDGDRVALRVEVPDSSTVDTMLCTITAPTTGVHSATDHDQYMSLNKKQCKVEIVVGRPSRGPGSDF